MTDRIYSLDAIRILAVWFVVVIHTNPFAGLGPAGNAANFVLESTARFAVPFFFVTAGYFFARKTARRDPTEYVVRRVSALSSLYVFGIVLSLPVFLAGTVAGAAVEGRSVTRSVSSRLAEAASPVDLFYYGTSVSEILWFLPALAFSFLFIYAFVVTDRVAYVLPISFALHAIGLLGASYTMVVDVPFQIRDALFFGFFYTSLGYAVYASEWRPAPDRSGLYLGATLLFAALHVGERYVLGYVVHGMSFADGVYSPSYTVATALVTLSLFAFLLSRPRFGAGTSLPSWGRYAVGIYVAHPPVLFVLQTVGDAATGLGYELSNTVLWHLVLTPATFFGALALYLGAHRLGMIEIGGSHFPRFRRRREQYSR